MIKGYVDELNAIKQELKVLNMRRKKLLEKEKELSEKIQDFLRSRNQQGVKYQGQALLIEEKETRKPAKPKERTENEIAILQKYGISDAEALLAELREASKGETKVSTKLKIKSYK